MKTTFIRRAELESRLGLSRSTIYKQINEGLLPAPIMIGMRAVAWIEDEVEQYQRALMMEFNPNELRDFIGQLHQARKVYSEPLAKSIGSSFHQQRNGAQA